jgi:hypothetical protein
VLSSHRDHAPQHNRVVSFFLQNLGNVVLTNYIITSPNCRMTFLRFLLSWAVQITGCFWRMMKRWISSSFTYLDYVLVVVINRDWDQSDLSLIGPPWIILAYPYTDRDLESRWTKLVSILPSSIYTCISTLGRRYTGHSLNASQPREPHLMARKPNY